MTHTSKVQIAVFESPRAADAAVERLLAAGIASERISVICPEGISLDADVDQHDPSHVTAESGAFIGAATGSALGALVAAAGVAASGGTALLVAGSLIPAGAAMGVAGGLIGAMTARGIDPEVADFYDQALRDGRVLVAVEADEADSSSPLYADALMSMSGGRTTEIPE